MPALRTHNHVQLLELDADKPSLPTLAVIAPTPRTSSFTFPISHNLDISPYSTPSNSPFEPDLNSMDLTSPASSYLPTPPSTRPLSRESSVSVSSPSSNAGADAERRPKKGDGDYVKRPENAFILFRRKCCEDRQQAEEGGRTKKQRQADLSKTISQKWKNLPLKDREYWEDLAKEKKRKHQEMYPDYVYRPQRVRDKDGRVRNKTYTKRNRGKRSEQREVDTEGETAFVVRSTSRSTSASTTPLSYHTVHIPIVLPRSSCSSSPSLPISVQPNSYAEIPDFDYVPNSRSSNSDSLFQLQARSLQVKSSSMVRVIPQADGVLSNSRQIWFAISSIFRTRLQI
ncbi:hypothetical protein BDP27DRAFT_1281802 [Rhodocollybia butyracea]|uniref:HMG box domain-containing protein n=1 Tax=Rhodocollybia butyracea TaxID=206335 RepID=A0A9P5UG40_9AGAR|nr:hypothetical protein BDP27DRAFT_1281802 [Rhodocollybia butyracea]